ncbi:hypothetical protein ACT2FY_07920 [Paraburkholderia fungorum]|uniref:hypothetical protein n=1 Tax=Paraburkholderia fungorum TaxID=134537 RepID=UPI00402B6792
MADIYLLAGLTLPQGVAHESLPGTVMLFMADCWPGMSRTQMIARAKRRGLRLSFRATAPCPSGDTGVFELRFNAGAGECLMLARFRRVGSRLFLPIPRKQKIFLKHVPGLAFRGVRRRKMVRKMRFSRDGYGSPGWDLACTIRVQYAGSA